MDNNNNMGNNGNAPENNNGTAPGNNDPRKLFTQEDVNRIVGERLARAKAAEGAESAKEKEAELAQREHRLYVKEQIASGAMPEGLGELFESLDKDTTDKVMEAIAPYIRKAEEPIMNPTGRIGGEGAGGVDLIRAAMGLKG